MPGPLVDNGALTDYTPSGKALSGGDIVQSVELFTATEGGTKSEFGTTANPVKVDGSNVTQPVSGTVTANIGTVATLATAAKQDTGNTSLASLLTELGDKLDEATFTGRVGEVQASPTANTVLARLKDLLSLIVLAAGDNNIGNVDVLTLPADPLGANADASVTAGATGSISAKLRRATQGLEDLKTMIVLAAGSANIGDVDVLTVPADPFGANADAAATAGSTGSMQAKFRLMTSQLDAVKTAVEALDNAADTTNNLVAVQVKPVSSATYAPTRFADLGANATANVKASAGNVFSLYCNSEAASDRFIQLHNSATTPTGGATPLYTFRIPPQGDVLVGTDFFTDGGARFSTGIAFAFSTTKDTYTAGTAADQSTLVHYV